MNEFWSGRTLLVWICLLLVQPPMGIGLPALQSKTNRNGVGIISSIFSDGVPMMCVVALLFLGSNWSNHRCPTVADRRRYVRTGVRTTCIVFEPWVSRCWWGSNCCDPTIVPQLWPIDAVTGAPVGVRLASCLNVGLSVVGGVWTVVIQPSFRVRQLWPTSTPLGVQPSCLNFIRCWRV